MRRIKKWPQVEHFYSPAYNYTSLFFRWLKNDSAYLLKAVLRRFISLSANDAFALSEVPSK